MFESAAWIALDATVRAQANTAYYMYRQNTRDSFAVERNLTEIGPFLCHQPSTHGTSGTQGTHRRADMHATSVDWETTADSAIVLHLSDHHKTLCQTLTIL